MYHIGLINIHNENEVLVQINSLGTDLNIININALSECLQNDPELCRDDRLQVNKVFVTLYILTGCDFTSFIVGLTKTSFAKTLVSYADFITGDTKIAPGTLACNNPDGNGFLACMRLVASAQAQTSFCWQNTTRPIPLI